jgi:hypothetical protein
MVSRQKAWKYIPIVHYSTSFASCPPRGAVVKKTLDTITGNESSYIGGI